VLQCRDVQCLTSAIARGPILAALDLHNPGLDIDAIIPQLKAINCRAIGFGSHVDAARLKAARSAGCDEVLPRSAFFEGLESKLRVWANVSGSKQEIATP
jgi:hypothetical protein